MFNTHTLFLLGCSFAVANSKVPYSYIEELLFSDSTTRFDNKAMAAPAEGLTLEKVFYDNY